MGKVARMPRTVTPMDRAAEERLLGLVEAAAAPLPRPEIFERVGDHFDDEEHLAKTLGRLVADGRLVRSKRERAGREEFVYAVHRGNAARLAIVADVSEKLQAPAQQAPEETMPKKPAAENDRYVKLLEARGTWLGPKEVSGVLLESPATSGNHLRRLAEEGRIQAKGEKRGLRYAALDTPDEPDAKPPKAAKSAPKKRAARRVKAVTEAMPAPQDSAPQLPAVVPQAGPIAWAIDDQGNVAIREGDKRIVLSPQDCEYGVSFLEKTQLLWRSAA